RREAALRKDDVGARHEVVAGNGDEAAREHHAEDVENTIPARFAEGHVVDAAGQAILREVHGTLLLHRRLLAAHYPPSHSLRSECVRPIVLHIIRSPPNYTVTLCVS